MLFGSDVVASVTRPLKELKGFKKALIKKGETMTVTFSLSADELAFYHNDMKFYAEPGKFMVFAGGSSDTTLAGEFELK